MPRVPGLERLRVRVLAAGAMRVRVVAVAVLALAGAGIALTLRPSTALNTFVSSSSRDYTATQAMYRQFGSDPVVVLVRGPLTGLLSPANIRTLSRLEACLGGQQLRLDPRLEAYVPIATANASPYGGRDSPCGTLMRERAAEVVYGPATFLNRAVAAVNTEVGSLTVNAVETIRAAEAAARTLAKSRKLDAAQTSAAVQAAGTLALERELASTGSTTGSANATGAQARLAGVPSIQDPTFLRQIVFGSRHGHVQALQPLLLSVPERRRRRHSGQAQGRARRPTATAGDRLDPRCRQAARVPDRRRGLHGHR